MPQQHDDESIADLMQKLLLKIGEDPERQGLVRTPQRADKALRFLTSGYETDLPKHRQWRAVRREVRRDGGGEGHRVLQHVRASPAAVLRNHARGLSAEQQGHRPEQNPAHRGHVRAAPAIAGAFDPSGGRNAQGRAAAQGRRRDLRSPPLLHDDARRGKAAFRHGDQRHAGRFSRAQGDARRVPLAGVARNHIL